MPADHVIEPAQEFRRAVHAAEQILPNIPAPSSRSASAPRSRPPVTATSNAAPNSRQRQGVPIYRVGSLSRKAQPRDGRAFVASGQHYWNSGIFVWRAATILRSAAHNSRSSHAAVERIAAAWDTPERDEVLTRRIRGISTRSASTTPSWSKRPKCLIVQAPFQWDDVGSWLALERRHPQDADDNTVLAKHLGIDTQQLRHRRRRGQAHRHDRRQRSHHHSGRRRDSVAHRHDEGNIKKIVEQLKTRGLEKYL